MNFLEKNILPDRLIRVGIRRLLHQRLRQEGAGDLEAQSQRRADFVDLLQKSPIAMQTAAANEQHYEVPTQFYQMVLGPHLKYSSGYWADGKTTLAESEDAMLRLTCHRAGLRDGQQILELGCGWGSLSLYMAARYPASQITAVSNSRTQKIYIDGEIAKRGLKNLTIQTADMNDFQAPGSYDRIVSVEMFEHMRNYALLMERINRWLKTDGRLFVHIFVHRDFAYPFEVKDDSDWMARYFFTGGIMPSDHLLLYFNEHLRIDSHWRVDGTHYQRTSEAWLANMDSHRKTLMPLMAATYGADQAVKWWAYWRIFFMSCAELWGFRGGKEWFVSHYLFRKNASETGR